MSMNVWHLEAELPNARVFKAQATRKDGALADLYASEDGTWSVLKAGSMDKPVGEGRAGSLDAAQLIARLVWELSA